ncbi:hypothetical protein [Streptomyces sioyaensis]|uniref:hypothetical protein n=1 Tax=Streptomyces sioyaensis TaxID=67364 RepID=UPI003720C3FE
MALRISGRAAKWLILAVLAIAAVVCFVLEHTVATDQGLPKDLLHAIGESFAVALFLGLGGDFYLKWKLGEESVKRGVQGALGETMGFLDPAQPQALRATVQQLASSNVYIRQVLWNLDFEWANSDESLVKLHMSRRVTGVSLARGGYRPKRDLWVLTSVEGRQSQYLEYVLHCPTTNINVSEDEVGLKPFLAEANGKLRLNQEGLLGERLSVEQNVPFGESFIQNRSACMYQASVSWVPLMHGDFEITCKLQLGGSALPYLSVSVFHPGGEMTDRDWVYLGGELPIKSKEWRNVTPGQATIVSWVPKAYVLMKFRPERARR